VSHPRPAPVPAHPRPALAPHCLAVAAALDDVLEGGVPKEALAGTGCLTEAAEGWVRAFAGAEEAYDGAAPLLRAGDGRAPDTGHPAVLRLVVAAAGLAALARGAGLAAAGPLAALDGAVAALYAASAAARDAGAAPLRSALAALAA
jgi:hypothetical protein